MTCIIGIEHKGRVFLGGDSAATNGRLDQSLIREPKVFKKGDFVFGICGSPKILNVLQSSTQIPKKPKGQDDKSYIMNVVVPAITESFKEMGCTVEQGGMTLFEGAVLFGFNGKLYQMQMNFQVITNAFDYDAIGSGANIAKGALHTSRGARDVKKRILEALDASAISNAGVRPPFTIVSTERSFF